MNPYPHEYQTLGHGPIVVRNIGEGRNGATRGQSGDAGWWVYSRHTADLPWSKPKIVGVTAYLAHELKLAGFGVSDAPKEGGKSLTAWCDPLYVASDVLHNGIPLITMAFRLSMEVDWRCGLDHDGGSVWKKVYYGKGNSGPVPLYTATERVSMIHRAYARAMEQIVWKYVNDVIAYVASGKKPSADHVLGRGYMGSDYTGIYWINRAQLGSSTQFADLDAQVGMAVKDLGFQRDKFYTDDQVGYTLTKKLIPPELAGLRGADSYIRVDVNWNPPTITIRDYWNIKETEFIRELKGRIEKRLEEHYGIRGLKFERERPSDSAWWQ